MMHEEIGGYRMLRRLGEGARAVILLGHPMGESGAAPVAVKAYRSGAEPAEPLHEAAALDRAAGAHVVRLLDVATAPDGIPALVLERIGGGSLARLLAQRAVLQPGEAITVLAPLGLTLLRLHAAGVAHGRLRAEAVHFDGGGAPVLLGFGGAQLFEPGLSAAGLAAETAAVDDVRQFRMLADSVLSRLPVTRAVQALRDPLPPGADEHEALRAWIEQLFDLDAALPVTLDTAPIEAERSLPARTPMSAPVEPEPVPAVAAVTGMPEWLDEPVRRLLEQLHGLRARFGPVRRRVWIPAALAGASFIAALALLLAGGTEAVPAAEPAAESAVAEVPEPIEPVAPEDPVEAALALLQARERCLLELSVLCLDAVGQAGSAALAADQQLLRQLQGGAELPPPWQIDPLQVELVERLGDSALVTLGDVPETQPASLLLMQGEAGWRIRGYLDQ